MYCGCRGFCAKSRWGVFVLALLAATALLIAGLVKTVPDLKILFNCTTKENALSQSGVCWKAFWDKSALFFILTCIGVGCLLISLLTCCCFCCAKPPGARKGKGQFIADGGYDTAAHPDQYAHTAPGHGKV